MLSLLHPGCEKYGGQRCYSVIRLDCFASSCRRTARRAGNRHNFTRLPCDPVATGPQMPVHLSDVSAAKEKKRLNKHQTNRLTHGSLNTQSDMDDVHYGIKSTPHGVTNSEKADVTSVLFSLASIGSEGRL